MRLSALDDRHTDWLRDALMEDPARHAYLLALVEARGSADISGLGGTLYGVHDAHGLAAAYWVGGSIVAIGATPETNRPIATLLNARGRWGASIIGDSAWVLDLAASLRWGEPRGIRPDQPLLVQERTPDVAPHPDVRVGGIQDLGAVFPASVAMFTEEVGFSPVENGERDYRARVRSLLESGRTLLITEQREADGRGLRRWPAARQEQQVVFKADLGICTSAVVQVQGVWTHPDHRGRGIASAAMAAVSAHVQRTIAPMVSLYANAYNAPALRVYEKAGYVQRGTFATVMY